MRRQIDAVAGTQRNSEAPGKIGEGRDAAALSHFQVAFRFSTGALRIGGDLIAPEMFMHRSAKSWPSKTRALLRICVAVVSTLAAAAGNARPQAEEPVALGWSAEEVDGLTMTNLSSITQRAERAGQLGCRRQCERLERIFARLLIEARTRSARAGALAWTLTVIRLPDVEALALPGGQVVISEVFIERGALSDEALAFVLAHEMSHSILEHERHALTVARGLLPQQVPRSVEDMYVELDFNMSLLKAMEPVMQQGELDADQFGLSLAGAAGYAAKRQLEFLEQECAQPAGPTPMVATHPPPCLRLARLRARLSGDGGRSPPMGPIANEPAWPGEESR